MTKVELLSALKGFTEHAVRGLMLPVRYQECDDVPPKPRAAKVYSMRLTKSGASQKAAPYIIHQLITGKDSQVGGARCSGTANVRSIFCVYNEDEQQGGLLLLGLMERLRVNLLKRIVIAGQFQLCLKGDGLEALIYPDDTAPYYIGEMMSVWHLPAVEREVGFNHGY